MRRSSNGRMERALALLARPCVIAALCVPVLSGCASDDTSAARDRPSATNAATPAPAAAPETAISATRTSRSNRSSKPQKPAAPKTVATPQFVRCDSNLSVRAATTTCGLAQNVFYWFFMEADESEQKNAFDAYSPASHKTYAMSCRTHYAEDVRCVADDGGEVRFQLAALLDYDDEQAATYARTHNLGPSHRDDASSDEGRADESGALPSDGGSSDDPDLSYGDEILYYNEGRGYRVQCADGMYSKSGGIQGACSGHGGLVDSPTSSDPDPVVQPAESE